jgi:alkylation response protein AidB-like acyl-CoA dehydrogenase
VNFELTHEQRELVAAVETLLTRRAGPARARAALSQDGLDRELISAFADGGFLDVAAEGAGPLEATLIAEAVGRQLGCAPIAVRCLVGPALFPDGAPDVLAWARAGELGTVRYGAHADIVLVDEPGGGLTLARAQAAGSEIAYGYPVAAIVVTEVIERLEPAASARARAWWRVAVAAEAVGLMESALRMTTQYVSDRRQFGRPLGSLQALQHRLAELFVSVEGARWLTRYAAYSDAEPSAAAAAAAAAATAAGDTVREAHQMHGAIGLTNEYDLHLWTMRLQSLRLEMGGQAVHARAVTHQRWGRNSGGEPAAHDRTAQGGRIG